ncbi:MAG: transposase [Desulfobaccales bacterium]
MPGTLEFAIHTLVEKRLDMSIFECKYRNVETGRAAYDPKVLLKVVLLAYSRGLISSRKIEQACRENVVFMALACGQQPDHSTIAAFVSSRKDEILPLFRDVLLVCEEMNLLGGTMFTLDGCKGMRADLPAGGCFVNRNRWGWRQGEIKDSTEGLRGWRKIKDMSWICRVFWGRGISFGL